MLEGTSGSHIVNQLHEAGSILRSDNIAQGFSQSGLAHPFGPVGLLKPFASKCLLNNITFPHYTLIKCFLVAHFPLHLQKNNRRNFLF